MTVMTVEKAMKRVSRGVKLLNKEMPGWRSLIEVDTLRLEHEEACVIGQVMGNFENLEELGIPLDDAWRFGFDTDNETTYEDTNYNYHLLQECWIFAINRG